MKKLLAILLVMLTSCTIYQLQLDKNHIGIRFPHSCRIGISTIRGSIQQ